ncbi:MAG: glycosyltransferase family 2 protein [bacterium]|nr:glycosyltransferase family 2 protein [bacterium]
MNMVSAVVLTHNEKKNIERCLQALSFCDEIVVLDDNSTDATIDIAQKMKAKMVKRTSKGNFSEQRNFALTEVKGDWILFVDADEIVTNELKKSILENIVKDSPIVYYIKRRDFFWGKELQYGETAKARNKGIIRLVKKNSGVWRGLVHEEFIFSGESGKLSGFLDHYPHQSLKEFIYDINAYSTIRAKELLQQGKQPHIREILLYPFGKFLLTYLIYLGFLDGPAGFCYAFMMSFHSFLVRAKVYQYVKIDRKT